MGDSEGEEFAPLFDYSHAQPASICFLSDDDSDFDPLVSQGNRKRKSECHMEEKYKTGSKLVGIFAGEEEVRGNKKNDDGEDWLPPPPKVPPVGLGVLGDRTLRELRSAKQELAAVAQSAKDLLNSLTESVKIDVNVLEKSDGKVNGDIQSNQVEREKVIISIQDKSGKKQFRMYMDDKFERLFNMYAEKMKIKLESLTFSFDGEKISSTATPASLGLEDDDIIEVHSKSI